MNSAPRRAECHQSVVDLDDYIIQERPTLRYISTSMAVFTDGDDTTDYYPQAAAVTSVTNSPHNVYLVGTGEGVPLATLQALGKTGYVRAATTADLGASFEASAQVRAVPDSHGFGAWPMSMLRPNEMTTEQMGPFIVYT